LSRGRGSPPDSSRLLPAYNQSAVAGVLSHVWRCDIAHPRVALKSFAFRSAIAAIAAVLAGRGLGSTPHVGCLDPAFDRRGRLTFLGWQETASKSGEWVVRWHDGHATRLFRLRRPAAFDAAIAVDQAGNAVLLAGYSSRQLWRWSGGSLTLLRGPGVQPAVSNPVWLAR